MVPPCGKDGVARVELGRPWATNAQFTTLGGVLYATAYDFPHGGFGRPDVGITLLYIGESVLDFELGRKPANTLATVQLVEDDFNKFELPVGTYWVVSTNDADVAIVSCKAGGVSDPVTAP